MRFVSSMVLLSLCLAFVSAPVARADGLGDMEAFPAVLIGLTVVAVDVANIVYIAQGDGHNGWGWAGTVIGGTILLATALDSGSEPEQYVAGGVTAALGIWSLAWSERPGEGSPFPLRVAPGLAYRRDEGIEPRIIATLGF